MTLQLIVHILGLKIPFMCSKKVSKKSSETHLYKARKGSASFIEISSLYHSDMSEVLLNQDSSYSWISNQNWALRSNVGEGHTKGIIVKDSHGGSNSVQPWHDSVTQEILLDINLHYFVMFFVWAALTSVDRLMIILSWRFNTRNSEKCKRVWTHWR